MRRKAYVRWLVLILVFCFGCSSRYVFGGELGVIACYEFKQGKEDILKDSSGNNNDGKIYGARWVKDEHGYALEFDGIDDYAEIVPMPSLNIGSPISILLWIMPKALPKSHSGYHGHYLIALNKGSRSAPGGNWYLGVSNKSILFDYRPLCDEYGWRRYIVETGEISLDTWHLLAVTHNGEDLRFYFDGKLVKEFTEVEKMAEGSYPLRIGSYEWNDYYFCGLINEVRIYNRALSSDEVKVKYRKRFE